MLTKEDMQYLPMYIKRYDCMIEVMHELGARHGSLLFLLFIYLFIFSNATF